MAATPLPSSAACQRSVGQLGGCGIVERPEVAALGIIVKPVGVRRAGKHVPALAVASGYAGDGPPLAADPASGWLERSGHTFVEELTQPRSGAVPSCWDRGSTSSAEVSASRRWWPGCRAVGQPSR
jgi:hypothetical protein